MQVPTKQIPWMKTLFPGYRKRAVNVVAGTKVSFYDLNWSGGTRNEYTIVDLATGDTKSFGRWNQIAPWNNPYEGATVDLPVGFAIVETGFFCGKEKTARILVHPDNMPKLLG